MSFDVPGVKELALKLARWIDPSRDGYYSGDHHIHSAGCSHYENPTEGVTPEAMWPQIEGEALNLGSVLIWGPSLLSPETVLHRPGSSAVETGSRLCATTWRSPAFRPAMPVTWCCSA